MRQMTSFTRALQYAMTGNYIDFGMAAGVSRQKLHELIEAAGDIDLGSDYEAFKSDLAHTTVAGFFARQTAERLFSTRCVSPKLRRCIRI